MIEVIYKEENQEAQNGEGTFGLPKNIRQIGLIREDYKIYMEDYVYTFLVRLARAEEAGKTKTRVAVLTGETKWQGGTTYLFIKGAVMAEGMEAALDHIDFSTEIWQKIHEEQKKYFEDQEIVGWFYSQPQLSIEISEVLTKVHLKHFGGEKVLMLLEPQEREDAFFRYENNTMTRLGGYYLYYEKNPYMQSYMLDKNKVLQPDIGEQYEDKAVKDFRKIITDKNGEKKEREAPSVFLWGNCLPCSGCSCGGRKFLQKLSGISAAERRQCDRFFSDRRGSVAVTEGRNEQFGKRKPEFVRHEYTKY